GAAGALLLRRMSIAFSSTGRRHEGRSFSVKPRCGSVRATRYGPAGDSAVLAADGFTQGGVKTPPLLTEGAPPTGGIVMSQASLVIQETPLDAIRLHPRNLRRQGHDDSSCRRCSLRQER